MKSHDSSHNFTSQIQLKHNISKQESKNPPRPAIPLQQHMNQSVQKNPLHLLSPPTLTQKQPRFTATELYFPRLSCLRLGSGGYALVATRVYLYSGIKMTTGQRTNYCRMATFRSGAGRPNKAGDPLSPIIDLGTMAVLYDEDSRWERGGGC